MKRVILAVSAVVVAILAGGFTSASATDAAPAADDAVLGPDGYKGLRLGQSVAEAEATGLLVDKRVNGDCTSYFLAPSEGEQNPGSGVWIDDTLGVVFIGGSTLSRTPENVTMGTHLTFVQAAYPNLTQVPPQDFVYETAVSGHPELTYRFAFTVDDRVSDFALVGPDLGGCAAA